MIYGINLNSEGYNDTRKQTTLTDKNYETKLNCNNAIMTFSVLNACCSNLEEVTVPLTSHNVSVLKIMVFLDDD